MLLYIWVVVGSLVFIIALIYLIGFVLPQKYEAKVVAIIEAPEKNVWSAIMDVEKNPMTGQMKKRIEPQMDSNGRPTWIEDIGSSRILVKTIESTPPLFIQRTMQDMVTPMTAAFEARLSHDPAGCRIEANWVTHIPNGSWHMPLFRVMMTVTKGARSTLVNYIRRMAINMGVRAEFRRA